MRVAVTGAAGFIGSHVCRDLESLGHEVVRLVRPDLDNWKTLSYEIRDAGALVHCAWSGHPRNEVESQRNIYTSLTVAKAMEFTGTQHMVFMSTGGGITGTTSYATSKREVESLLSKEFGLFNFDLTVLRPTAVYGPGQDPSKGLGAVTTFLYSVLNDKPIHILGSPYSGRDFLHVEDLAECVSGVVEERALGLFEVGGPEVVSLNELIKMIEGVTGKKANVQVENPSGVDPQIVSLNNDPIFDAIGWEPERRVIDFLKEYRVSNRNNLSSQ